MAGSVAFPCHQGGSAIKTKLCISVAVATTLLTASALAATTRDYSGSVKPSGQISLTVTRGGGRRTVTKLQFTGVPITCKDGAHTASGLDDQDKTPVKSGHFRFVGRSDQTGNKSKLVIAGTYVKHHWRGALRLRGSRVPVDSGTGKRCDTSRLSWRATKS